MTRRRTPTKRGLAFSQWPASDFRLSATSVFRLTNSSAPDYPSIEIVDSKGSIGAAIGTAENVFEYSIFAGADEWIATIGRGPQPLGDSNNPFGGGAAACLACANLFRFIFTGGADQLDRRASYSTYHGDTIANWGSQPPLEGAIQRASVLVGAGAIGNAAAWALARAPLGRRNLHSASGGTNQGGLTQRTPLPGGLEVHSAQQRRQDFVEGMGYEWSHALLALDSAKDRMAVQVSLPEHVINAWTQIGDLGVSVHDRFTGPRACVCCLYLPSQVTKNQDEIVAQALKIEDALQDVRRLLHTGPHHRRRCSTASPNGSTSKETF